MRRVSRRHWTEWYDPSLPFVAEVGPGERVVVEVGKGSRIPTGPIGITGATPGDALVVEIVDITMSPTVPGGSMNVNARPGRGFAGERIAESRSESFFRPLVTAGEWIIFDERIRVPLRPSVGVVATQPPDRRLPTIWPWRYGGNLDCHDVRPGTRVYLPVGIPGAGLTLGDIHGAIGDGEVMTSGAEVAGEITISTRVYPNRELRWPVLETAGEIAVLASARTLEEAAVIAHEELAGLLQLRLGLTLDEALVALGLAGAIRVCQIVNPLVTVRAAIPRAVAPALFV